MDSMVIAPGPEHYVETVSNAGGIVGVIGVALFAFGVVCSMIVNMELVRSAGQYEQRKVFNTMMGIDAVMWFTNIVATVIGGTGTVVVLARQLSNGYVQAGIITISVMLVLKLLNRSETSAAMSPVFNEHDGGTSPIVPVDAAGKRPMDNPGATMHTGDAGENGLQEHVMRLSDALRDADSLAQSGYCDADGYDTGDTDDTASGKNDIDDLFR